MSETVWNDDMLVYMLEEDLGRRNPSQATLTYFNMLIATAKRKSAESEWQSLNRSQIRQTRILWSHTLRGFIESARLLVRIHTCLVRFGIC